MPETWDRFKDRIRGMFVRETAQQEQSATNTDRRAAADANANAAKESILANRTPEERLRIEAAFSDAMDDEPHANQTKVWIDAGRRIDEQNKLGAAAKLDAMAYHTPEDQERIIAAWRESSKDPTVEPDVAWEEAAFQIHHEDNLRDLMLESDAGHDYNLAREPDEEFGGASKEDEDLVIKLREYSSGLGEEVTHAEQLITTRLATEIEAQDFRINLSQRYDTADQTVASQRHEKAIQNLEPLIQEAEELGYSINRGNAITGRLQQAEKIAPLDEARTIAKRMAIHSIGMGMRD